MKKIIIFLLTALLTALVVSGCSSKGDEDKFSASYLNSHLIPNKTTMAEVQAIYGVPDGQMTKSNGVVNWKYQKRGNLHTASSLASYIPGGGAISSALGLANSAADASDAASGASDKVAGNSEHHGDFLNIWFKDKVLEEWTL